jgi:hypothetical protein
VEREIRARNRKKYVVMGGEEEKGGHVGRVSHFWNETRLLFSTKEVAYTNTNVDED